MPLVALVLALTMMGLGLVACGVQDSGTRSVSAADVPYGLLEQAPSTTSSSIRPTPPTDRVDVFVYLVAGNRVQAVIRELGPPPTVPKAVAALVLGPSESEAVTGVRTAINPTANITPRQTGPTVLVDLGPEFIQVSTAEQLLGLAQIVFTLTEVPGVTGVRFTLAGTPIQVPTAGGTPTAGPVGRDAFPNQTPDLPGAQPS